MTKKHFIDLADTIKCHNHQARLDNQNVTAFTDDQIAVIACFCKQQNSNFKRERWLEYIAGTCGKNGGKV